MFKRTCFLLVLIVSLGWTASPALAQKRPTRDEVLTRVFRDVNREVAGSVLRLSRGRSPIGYATVIERGWAVTSERLVREGDSFRLETTGGDGVAARVVGREGWLDVALLRFDPDRIVAPPLRARANADVGRWVVSPGGKELPLAVGVVSATDRDVQAGRKSPIIGFPFLDQGFSTPMREYRGVIQHDSPLEEGELGGPLLDGAGRWLGVNVAKPHRGTCYATPHADILAALPGLKAGQMTDPPPDREQGPEILDPRKLMEEVGRDFLGDETYEIARDMARAFGEIFGDEEFDEEDSREFLEGLGQKLLEELDRIGRPPTPPPPPPPPRGPGYLGVQPAEKLLPGGGLEVKKVVEGTPGERAGFRPGDVIMAVDGDAVPSYAALKEFFSKLKAGDKVVITYRRKDPDTGEWQWATVRVTLDRHPRKGR